MWIDRAAWTVSALHTGAGQPLTNVYDNDATTRWATGAVVVITGASQDWFKIDVGTSVNMTGFRITDTSYQSDIPLAGDIQTSPDDVTYTTQASWTSSDISGGILTKSFTAVAARYMKLLATALPTVPTNWWSIGEIDLSVPDLPAAVVPGTAFMGRSLWTVTASRSGGGATSNMTDGNLGTRWATGGVMVLIGASRDYVQVDTGTLTNVCGIVLNNSSFTGDVPAAGDILTSTDNVTWTVQAQWTSTDISSGILTKTFTPVTARYLKLNPTKAPAVISNWWSIGELNILIPVLSSPAFRQPFPMRQGPWKLPWTLRGLELAAATSAPPARVYTLTVSVGVFAEAGSAATLLADRSLGMAIGAFAESGQNAALLADRLLSPASGVYALGGNTATLLASRTLGAASSAFVESGQNASLLVARQLAAASSTYALTGNPATLLANRTLGAAVTVFIESGQSAALLAAHQLAATSGTYWLTGVASPLLANRALAPASSAFILSAADAFLARHFLMTLGVYATSGAEGVLARALAAGTGAFLLAPHDVSFRHGLPYQSMDGRFSIYPRFEGLVTITPLTYTSMGGVVRMRPALEGIITIRPWE